MVSGRSLKTGAGELARMTISPFIRASVFPIKVLMPLVRLKSPRIAMMGIVSPMTARNVRVGRVIKFCQANRHMKRPQSFIARARHTQADRFRGMELETGGQTSRCMSPWKSKQSYSYSRATRAR